MAIDGLEGLLLFAQLSVLEIHPWGSREDNIDKPDQIVFDLDPGPGSISAAGGLRHARARNARIARAAAL